MLFIVFGFIDFHKNLIIWTAQMYDFMIVKAYIAVIVNNN